ncbi:MAG: hypothetical protein JNK47_16775 [Mesorhizobium sp.]|nr:hypothetical protein [Mesorhizobium sp.]MBL8578879.1 hypothetical protein [Mesorhizobium sp.]
MTLDDRKALSLLRLLCSSGPQALAKLDRAAVDNLVARGLASITKRGLAVGATTSGFAIHKSTEHSSIFRAR